MVSRGKVFFTISVLCLVEAINVVFPNWNKEMVAFGRRNFCRHTFPATIFPPHFSRYFTLVVNQTDWNDDRIIKTGKVIAQTNRNKGEESKEITNCLFMNVFCLRFTSGIDCLTSYSRCQRTEIPPRWLEIIPWNCVWSFPSCQVSPWRKTGDSPKFCMSSTQGLVKLRRKTSYFYRAKSTNLALNI